MDSSVSDISWRLLLLKFCTNRRSEKKQQQHILYNTDNAKQAGKSLALPAFLSNRTQSVLCQGSTSPPQTVISGVPQGTVLGPLRFSASRFLICPVICLLYRRINTTQDTNILQWDLNNLQKWEARWQMMFNTDKCQRHQEVWSGTITTDAPCRDVTRLGLGGLKPPKARRSPLKLERQ